MMDKQKVIVVLLLVTIVFSIVSLILTVGVDMPDVKKSDDVINVYRPAKGVVGLEIVHNDTNYTNISYGGPQ